MNSPWVNGEGGEYVELPLARFESDNAVASFRCRFSKRNFSSARLAALLSVAVALCLATTALSTSAAPAPLAQNVAFEDHAGNLKLTNANKFRVYTAGQFVGVAPSGEKIHLISTKQEFSADCSKIEGTFSGAQGSGLKIQTATMSGGVHAVVSRPSSVAGKQTSTMDGEKAVYTAAQNNLRITGGVTVHNVDPAASQIVNAEGSDADLTLIPPGTPGQPIRSGTVNGPVKFDMKGTRLSSEQGQPAKRTPFTMTGSCDTLKYDQALETITLIGHVHTTGNDPMSGGDVNAAIETIHLNPNGTLDYVEWQGSPGMTVIDTKALGGGP